jgi:hypothetical protein
MSQHEGHGHLHTHSPEIVIDDAVIVQVTKLALEMGDTVWVKVDKEAPYARDWDALHLMQHGLQEVLDHQYPDLSLLVIVAPGDASPVILRPPRSEAIDEPFAHPEHAIEDPGNQAVTEL